MAEWQGRPQRKRTSVKPLQTRLRQLRKSKGWTNKQLAEACGVQPSTVSGWFNPYSPRLPDAASLKAIAESTGYSLNWILLGPPHPELLGDAASIADIEDAVQAHIEARLFGGRARSQLEALLVPTGKELLEGALRAAKARKSEMVGAIGKTLTEIRASSPGISRDQELAIYRIKAGIEDPTDTGPLRVSFPDYLRLLATAIRTRNPSEWKYLLAAVAQRIQAEGPNTYRAFMDHPPAELELIIALQEVVAKDPSVLKGTPFEDLNLSSRETEVREMVRQVERDKNRSPEEMAKSEELWNILTSSKGMDELAWEITSETEGGSGPYGLRF